MTFCLPWQFDDQYIWYLYDVHGREIGYVEMSIGDYYSVDYYAFDRYSVLRSSRSLAEAQQAVEEMWSVQFVDERLANLA